MTTVTKGLASAGPFVFVNESHSGGQWCADAAGASAQTNQNRPHSMLSTERSRTSAVDAVLSGRHVDITGPPLSGRTSMLAQVCRHFRELGWEVLEVQGSNPPSLLPALDTDRALIAVDDWEQLDEETRSLIQASSAVVITTRAAGGPALPDMHHLPIPPMPADALRVLLVRSVGLVVRPEEVESLHALTDGAVGTALGIAAAAQQQGALTSTEGHGQLAGGWLDASADVVALLLSPLTAEQVEALAAAARQPVLPLTGAAAELGELGYLHRETGRPSSTLLSEWFTRP